MKESLAKYKSDFPVLETERIRLRKIRPDDRDAIFAIMSDTEVMRYYNFFPLTEQGQADELIKKMQDNFSAGYGIRWAIELKENYSLIGTIGFHNREENPFSAGIGYEIGSAWRGNGYIPEVINAIVDFGFSKLKLERIEALVVDGNTASQRVLEKCRFAYEGLLRKKGFWKNELHDLHSYSIFKNDISES